MCSLLLLMLFLKMSTQSFFIFEHVFLFGKGQFNLFQLLDIF